MLDFRFSKTVSFIVSLVMIMACFTYSYNDDVYATNTNLQYYRYDHTLENDDPNTQADNVTIYTLNAVPYTDNSRISAQDNRVPDNGNKSVVHLESDSGMTATGFIVAKNVIATAAHCLYDRTTEKFVTGLRVEVCENNASNILAAYTPVSSHVPANHINYTEEPKYSSYDYALLYLGENVDLTSYGILSLGIPTDQFLAKRTRSVYATGFPGEINIDEPNSNMTRYKSGGGIMPFTQDAATFPLSQDLRFSSTCIISPGDSGGPLYYMTDSYDGEDQVTAIGIVTGGGYYNGVYINTSGVRITTDLLHFFLNNNYL